MNEQTYSNTRGKKHANNAQNGKIYSCLCEPEQFWHTRGKIVDSHSPGMLTHQSLLCIDGHIIQLDHH